MASGLNATGFTEFFVFFLQASLKIKGLKPYWIGHTGKGRRTECGSSSAMQQGCSGVAWEVNTRNEAWRLTFSNSIWVCLRSCSRSGAFVTNAWQARFMAAEFSAGIVRYPRRRGTHESRRSASSQPERKLPNQPQARWLKTASKMQAFQNPIVLLPAFQQWKPFRL